MPSEDDTQRTKKDLLEANNVEPIADRATSVTGITDVLGRRNARKMTYHPCQKRT